MSTINTNTLNANYPIPGQNNSSQGFRDNFTSTKNNLNIAAAEITDLQQNAILKAALGNTAGLDNNMAGAPLSNALVQGFRANIGNVLDNQISGNTLTINASYADVQVVNVGALNFSNSNVISLGFSNWFSPAGSAGEIQVIFGNIGNTQLSFVGSGVSANTLATVQNYNSLTQTVFAPVDVSTGNAATQANTLAFSFSTLDCGNTVAIAPVGLPRRAEQIVNRTPSAEPNGLKGNPGDTVGAVAVDSNYLWWANRSYDGVANIWNSVTSVAGYATQIENGASGVAVATNANVTIRVNNTTQLTATQGGVYASNVFSNTAVISTSLSTPVITSLSGNITLNSNIITSRNFSLSSSNIAVNSGNVVAAGSAYSGPGTGSGFVQGKLVLEPGAALNPAPTSSSSAGVVGQMAFDNGNIYVCCYDGQWRRAALSTF